jgi:hypothetical protein
VQGCKVVLMLSCAYFGARVQSSVYVSCAYFGARVQSSAHLTMLKYRFPVLIYIDI